MPSFVRKAKGLGVALACVDGIDVMPDPPQVAMLHVAVRGDRERINEAVLEIARDHRTLISGEFAPTPIPNIQRAELSIGAPALEIPTSEIAELYAELVSRVARPKKRRGTSPGSAAASRARKA
jgi:hypothetical protein